MIEDEDTQPLHRQSFAKLAQRAQRLRDDRERETRGRTLLRRRVALVSGFTSSFVARVLDVFLFELGIDAEIYETPYGSAIEQIINPSSQLYAFAPDVALLLVHRGNLDRVPQLLATPDECAALARREARRFHEYANTLLARMKTRVVLSNFELPAARPLGNLEVESPSAVLNYVRAVNAALAATRIPGVTLFDLDYLSARYGLERALDTKSHCLTKQPFAFDFLVPYCHALARSIAQSSGLSKKCAVLDLDGTLWGGTLAEDGKEQLVLGPDSAEGEAFLAFQTYLKQLKERGVLLAVCSKNDTELARQTFAELPHMALAPGDIACFVANWENKAANLQHIARQLNIGLDALVFIDNSAEERHLIRQQLPQVSVVELPDDPADYVRALDEGAYFELSELTEEALLRADSLLKNEARQQAETQFIDYDAYLRSLELHAEVKPIGGAAFLRCAELIQRSNQFNLRTVRHSEHELRAFVARPGNAGFCVSLGDRFGNYGIISVVLLERMEDALFIDTWLMSCRVLKKGVEALVFEEIAAAARRRGLAWLAAEYKQTAKNAMVEDLLPSFGFEPESTRSAPAVRYRLNLDAPRPAFEHFVRVTRSAEP